MSRRPFATPAVRRLAWAMFAVLGLLALGLGVSGCTRDPARDPLQREPALLIDAPALTRLLTRTRSLVGTPAGSASTRLLDRLQHCREIAGQFAPAETEAQSASSARALDRLVCRDDTSIDPALASQLERERGDHAGVLQWPVGRTGRAVVWVDVDSVGGAVFGGELVPSASSGASEVAGLASLLIPAATAPGEAAIDGARSLLHLQLRPAVGLRLAELIPSGSQGDRLFALKGRLLEGALLEGTLELAFVPPAPGGSVPLALVALHHRAAAPVEAALVEVLDQLERTWAITRTARRFPTRDGERIGGCYADLPILPELAPCWVVTETALLIGYRAEAFDAAIEAGAASASDPTDRGSRLVVDFERVRALDEQLADATATGVGELYSRLELHGRSDAAGRVALEGQLRARP
jgi:hypothetical protein